MTNGDKYLKDGISPKAMWYEFKNWYNDTLCTCAYGEATIVFLIWLNNKLDTRKKEMKNNTSRKRR